MLACYESRIEEEHDEETEGEVLPFDEDLGDALPKWIRMDFTRRDGWYPDHMVWREAERSSIVRSYRGDSRAGIHLLNVQPACTHPERVPTLHARSYLPTDGLNRRHHRARRFGARRQRNRAKAQVVRKSGADGGEYQH
jgi:hypothetical protein